MEVPDPFSTLYEARIYQTLKDMRNSDHARRTVPNTTFS